MAWPRHRAITNLCQQTPPLRRAYKWKPGKLGSEFDGLGAGEAAFIGLDVHNQTPQLRRARKWKPGKLVISIHQSRRCFGGIAAEAEAETENKWYLRPIG